MWGPRSLNKGTIFTFQVNEGQASSESSTYPRRERELGQLISLKDPRRGEGMAT